MRVMANGGSINADFQCGLVHESGILGRDVIIVSNSCKDGRPLTSWVCVCLPGLRYFHVDARHFGIPTRVKTPKDLRKHMIYMLCLGGFTDANALWDYARQHDLPRIVHEESCRRCGVVVQADDLELTAAVIKAAAHAPCRAMA